MSARKDWLVTARDDSGIRRYPLSRFRLCVVAMFLLVASYAAKQTHFEHYLASAKQQGKLSIVGVGIYRGGEQLWTEAKNAVSVERASQQSKLKTIELDVPKNTLQRMFATLRIGNQDLGHEAGGNKPYFKAMMRTEDAGLQRCKICLRGTMPWHHHPEKPSLRVKIKKEDLTGGPRYLELTRPEDPLAMKNWLASELASSLGLLHEHNQHVRVFLNGKYFGVYLCSMRQTELLALKSQRMPGTFFKGDFGGDLWDSITPWKLSGECDPRDVQVFKRFLTLVGESPSERQRVELRQLFDFERYAQWSALMIVRGSVHTDRNHNHSYFFCPNLGKLEPIFWDCNSFGMHAEPTTSPNVCLHPLMLALMQDQNWVQRRNEWIWQLLQGIGSEPSLLKTIDRHYGKLLPDLQADDQLQQVVLTHGGFQGLRVPVANLDDEKAKLKKWIHLRTDFLNDYLQNCRFQVATAGAEDATSIVLQGPVALRVQSTAGQQWLLSPGFEGEPNMSLSRPFEADLPAPHCESEAKGYLVPAEASALKYFNAVTGVEITPGSILSITDRSKVQYFEMTSLDGIKKERRVLGPGTFWLEEDLIVGSNEVLEISPGTTIMLAPDVGIYCAGQVLAEGSKKAPIRIVAARESELPESAWATFAIFGPGTAGSKFSHCHIKDGSTGSFQHRRFKGMFSVYNCPSVVIEKCHFGRNWIGDDAVNLAQTQFEIRNCQWRDARADGLDCDMAIGIIKDSQWIDSGNDALDLMTSRITIEKCVISGSGDKGISVGEASELNAQSVLIESCLIGTELKDDSVAEFQDCRFLENATGAHSYQKKWFYHRAGEAIFRDCQFVGSQVVDVHPEKRSRMFLRGTKVNSFAGSIDRLELEQAELPREVKGNFDYEPLTPAFSTGMTTSIAPQSGTANQGRESL
ncbi:MAG: CotH kinase family protein [Planctomycetota bacterium]|nr:CotH kinase family protein [Planctomycetota bacterium]